MHCKPGLQSSFSRKKTLRKNDPLNNQRLNSLEKMGKVNTVAFDKTGTLTYGRLEVSDIVPTSGISETELLKLAASAESRSEHPLGKAIAAKAKSDNVP